MRGSLGIGACAAGAAALSVACAPVAPRASEPPEPGSGTLELPVCHFGEEPQSAWPTLELDLRWFPAGGIPASVRLQHEALRAEPLPANRDVVDVAYQGEVLYSPFADLPDVRGGVQRRPDYWWKVARVLQEDLLRDCVVDFHGRPLAVLRVRADRRAPARTLGRLFATLSRDGLRVDQVELLVCGEGGGEECALRLPLSRSAGVLLPAEREIVPESDVEYGDGKATAWLYEAHPRPRRLFVPAGTTRAEIEELREKSGHTPVVLGVVTAKELNRPVPEVTVQEWVDTWAALRAVFGDVHVAP